MCLDIATGKVEFTDRSDGSERLVGKGSVIYVDDRLYTYGEKGGVGLVRIDPDGYELTGSFEIKKGSKEHWAHPAISDGRLYIRHGEVLMCYDVEAR
jgi:outer membrane protein assembly factor BamB